MSCKTVPSLLAAVCVLLLASSASALYTRLGPIGPTGKRVFTPSPGNLTKSTPSCVWSGFSCSSSLAPVFSPSSPVISSQNYPAWAKAYIAAGDLFCSAFAEDTCAWPCQFLAGVGCRLNGHSYYQAFNCPNTIAYNDNMCDAWPQQQGPASCLVQPTCSYSAESDGPDEDHCMSTFAANLTAAQRLYVFGDLYFNVMPRQLLGCCKGSVYNYKMNNFCDAAFDQNGNTSPQACAKVPGCTWDIKSVLGCVPSIKTDYSLQFAYQPADPMAPVLTQLEEECSAITDQQTCSSYKPVQVDKKKVQLYLMGNLQQYNSPVDVKSCPLPSIPPPWV